MDSEYIAKINKMNFRQLQEELSISSNNPVKSLLIRKLMKQKYLRYKKIRELANQQQRVKPRKNIDEESIMMANELLEEIGKGNNDTVLEVVNEFTDDDFNRHGPLNELDPSASLYDSKFADEIQRDQMNNHLMSRMNSDIHIQEIRRNKLKNFETPFSDTPNDRYAPFHNDPTIIPNKDFTAKSRFT
jgi:hypothetical protein